MTETPSSLRWTIELLTNRQRRTYLETGTLNTERLGDSRLSMKLRAFFAALVTASAITSVTAQCKPITLKTPSDSVRVIFGDIDQWVKFDPLKNPDTSRLNMQHDLILLSEVDSLFVPRSETPVEIQFQLSSGTHTEIFLFVIPPDVSKFELLKQYPAYRSDSVSESVSPIYPRASDSVMAKLREKYSLDSLAGTGSTSERAIRLLIWVHNSIRHDGNREGPTGATLERMAKAIDSGATMNCAGLAQTLAEFYCALGFTARAVVGLPYDTTDHECHQWTEVWSDQDQKWLFFDPTNNSYFIDPLGKPMQITEVRQELALGDPSLRDEFIRINDDFNWNGQPLDKDQYLNSN